MKKRQVAAIFSALLLALAVFAAACGDKNGPSSGVTWSDFEKELKGYVYEMFYFDLPTATDANGKELRVRAEVKDDEGKALDSTGGFFVIPEEGKYDITYSAVSGGTTYTADAAVTGILRADYSLATSKLYSVGDEVDLDELVLVSPTASRTYSVKRGSDEVEVNNGGFLCEEEGEYTVTVSVPDQESYTFTLVAVDPATNPLPNGKIFDATAANVGTVKTDVIYKTEKDETLINDASAAAAFDADEKYDEASEGAVKVTTTFPVKTRTNYVEIKIDPVFGLAYYKGLKNSGYDSVVMRMKVDTETTAYSTCFALIPFVSSTAFGQTISLYSRDGMFSRTLAASGWNGIFDYNIKSMIGEWFEVVVSLDNFIANFREEDMPLFYIVQMNQPDYVDTAGYHGGTTVWLDNVYCAKSISADGIVVKDYAIGDEINVGEEAGVEKAPEVDELFEESSYFDKPDDEIVNENGVATLGKKGVYSFLFRARNRYGAGGFQAKVGLEEDEGFIFESGEPDMYTVEKSFGSGTGTETGTAEIAASPDEAFKSGEGTVKLACTTNSGDKQMIVKLSFPIAFSKAYYEDLKSKGYDYIDFHIKVEQTGWESMCFFALKDRGSFMEGGCYTGEDFSQNVWKESAYWNNPTGQGIYSGANWGPAKLGWFTLRYPIDDFLTNYDTAGNFWIKSVPTSPGTFTFRLGAVRVVKDPSFVRPAYTA